MPLPAVAAAAAATAKVVIPWLLGLFGLGLGAKSAVDAHKAYVTMEDAERRNRNNLLRHDEAVWLTANEINALSEIRQTVFENFVKLSEIFEKIHNKQEFEQLAEMERFSGAQYSKISFGPLTHGALTGLGAATIFGTGTGLAASKLFMASGPVTAGAGFLVGGVVLAFTGSKLRIKADEARGTALRNEAVIERHINEYSKISVAAKEFTHFTNKLKKPYDSYVAELSNIVDRCTNFAEYSSEEKQLVKETVEAAVKLDKLIGSPLLKVVDGHSMETVLDSESVERAITEAKEFFRS